MQHIASHKNPLIKRLISLKTTKGRRIHGQFPIEGIRLMREAIQQNMQFSILAIEESCIDKGKYDDIIQYAQDMDTQLLAVPAYILERLCDTENPQGLYAVLPLPSYPIYDGHRMLALDGIADPGNMGTILRSAVAFGISDVLLSHGCADAFSPKCVRSGMGAHFRLKIHNVDALSDALDDLAKKGYNIIGASLAGEDKLQARKGKTVLVVGSEAHGMSESVTKRCTSLYKIPMTKGTDSLNAAVAAGIVLFQCFVEQNWD